MQYIVSNHSPQVKQYTCNQRVTVSGRFHTHVANSTFLQFTSVFYTFVIGEIENVSESNEPLYTVIEVVSNEWRYHTASINANRLAGTGAGAGLLKGGLRTKEIALVSARNFLPTPLHY